MLVRLNFIDLQVLPLSTPNDKETPFSAANSLHSHNSVALIEDFDFSRLSMEIDDDMYDIFMRLFVATSDSQETAPLLKENTMYNFQHMLLSLNQLEVTSAAIETAKCDIPEVAVDNKKVEQQPIGIIKADLILFTDSWDCIQINDDISTQEAVFPREPADMFSADLIEVLENGNEEFEDLINYDCEEGDFVSIEAEAMVVLPEVVYIVAQPAGKIQEAAQQEILLDENDKENESSIAIADVKSVAISLPVLATYNSADLAVNGNTNYVDCCSLNIKSKAANFDVASTNEKECVPTVESTVVSSAAVRDSGIFTEDVGNPDQVAQHPYRKRKESNVVEFEIRAGKRRKLSDIEYSDIPSRLQNR